MARAINYYAAPTCHKDEPEVDRLQELRIDVADTANLMGDNIQKGLLRGFKLEELENRSEHLEVEARQFQKTTHKMLSKYWWRSRRRSLLLGGLVVGVILIVVLAILLAVHPWRNADTSVDSGTQSPLAIHGQTSSTSLPVTKKHTDDNEIHKQMDGHTNRRK